MIVIFLIVTQILNALAQGGNLNVPEIKQEQSQLCWAACFQMVNEYYGGTQCIEQCNQANICLRTSQVGIDCCAASNAWCNRPTFSPEFIGCGYSSPAYNCMGGSIGCSGLSWTTLVDEIKAKRPVLFAHSFSSYNHMMVIRGYTEDLTNTDSRLLYINDPYTGKPKVISYNWYSAGGINNYHFYDIYGIQLTSAVAVSILSDDDGAATPIALSAPGSLKSADYASELLVWLNLLSDDANEDALKEHINIPLSADLEFYKTVPLCVLDNYTTTSTPTQIMNDMLTEDYTYYLPLKAADTIIADLVVSKESGGTDWILEFFGASQYDKTYLKVLKKVHRDDDFLSSSNSADSAQWKDLAKNTGMESENFYDQLTASTQPMAPPNTSGAPSSKVKLLYVPKCEMSFVIYYSWFRWCATSTADYACEQFSIASEESIPLKKLIELLQQ